MMEKNANHNCCLDKTKLLSLDRNIYSHRWLRRSHFDSRFGRGFGCWFGH
jgi:hypothetical protein